MLTQQQDLRAVDLSVVGPRFTLGTVIPQALQYSHSKFYLPTHYCSSCNVIILFGFYNVDRKARSQNKQPGCVTNSAPFLPCKSVQLVISNKWHFQLIVPGLLCVCVSCSHFSLEDGALCSFDRFSAPPLLLILSTVNPAVFNIYVISVSLWKKHTV